MKNFHRLIFFYLLISLSFTFVTNAAPSESKSVARVRVVKNSSDQKKKNEKAKTEKSAIVSPVASLVAPANSGANELAACEKCIADSFTSLAEKK